MKLLREFRIKKSDLVAADYYIGICRNGRVARWDGAKFLYWRTKFGKTFVEAINHEEDDQTFDVFDAILSVQAEQVREIPLDPEQESKESR